MPIGVIVNVCSVVMGGLAGSLLGMLPNIILSTLMGAALTDPKSPAFLLSTAGFLLLSAGSALWYAKRRKRREET